MYLFDKILTTTHDKAFIAVRKLAGNLSRMADEAVETHRSRQCDNFEDMIMHHDSDENFLPGVQDWNFDISENQTTVIPDFSVGDEVQRAFE
jgi:hypothetical protein